MVASQHVYGDIIIVEISGDLSISNLSQLDDLWEMSTSLKPSIIAFDCSRIKFIDSSAIGTLVKFLNNSEERKFTLVFLDLSQNIFKVFSTAKLNKIFKITTRSSFEKEHGISK